MSEAYLGEIRLFPIDWAPEQWLPCDGRTLKINTYAALYTLLGKQFGGDGKTEFNLPDLRGRTPIGLGTNPKETSPVDHTMGSSGGVEAVALNMTQIPPHTHQLVGTSDEGTIASPTTAANYLAQTPADHRLYAPYNAAAAVTLANDTVGVQGAGDEHSNMQPSLVLNYCICTVGAYPQRP